jgi:hypothetical protein
MSLLSGVNHWVSTHVMRPFIDKPGMDLPKGTANRDFTVEEKRGGINTVDHFLQTGAAKPKSAQTGAVLDMTPQVPGGFKEGDIVLRGNSAFTTFESGLVTSLTEWMRTGHWETHKSAVSHSGIVVRDPETQELRVVQMVSGATPEELAPKLTGAQKKLKATFLRNDSIADFFNDTATPITQATVMRPKDAAMGAKAAAKALEYYDTQVSGDTTHPWFAKLPHSLAPGGRGGVCSTFVDLAYDGHFKQKLHLPTTPEHFVVSPDLEMVGDRSVTDIEAAPATAAARSSVKKAA